MASARLFRVIVPVSSIDNAAVYYSAVLAQPGMRISPGRHYFDCGGTILACFDPRSDGDAWDATPNPDPVYFAVDDLEACQVRASQQRNGSILQPIETRPWGERSFYCADPFGNKLCFVVERTLVKPISKNSESSSQSWLYCGVHGKTSRIVTFT